MKTLTIISRKSHLAQIQAKTVGKRILKLFPSIEIKYIQKDTQGDIDLNTPLHKMPEIGVFTNDISCLLYTSPSPRDKRQSRMPSSA